MSQSAFAIEQFSDLESSSCEEKIRQIKHAMGNRLVVLGHHYQRDEVFQHADITGDSLKLSRLASATDAEYIVFCGVHFMAEVADILSSPGQTVILPDMAAGCAMADMANLVNVERCWKELGQVLNPDERVTPVTYINSAADLKAFCGRHGGIVCTSTNARDILQWSFDRREKVLFFPDQHLGRNTAYRMGIPLEQMVVWDFNLPMGGLTPQQIKDARLILWKGHCSVHQMFKPEQADRFREKYPNGKVIAHPECSFEVCQTADEVGSTEYIIETIRRSPRGSQWLVGTELNLVNRLREQFKEEGKEIFFMSPMICMCSTMFRIDPQHLLWALENLLHDHPVNRIRVPEGIASEARLSLERMFSV
ncbi:MAG: quinolinate synthase NadA [Gammaproteobacteria bacterium]|nr:MAG: quinolinate synthase NadA [Gammaproteobacteria bacterium]